VSHGTAFHINGLQIVLDEPQRQLTINGRRLHLGAQEYSVARALVVHYAAYKARQTDEPVASFAALCKAAGVPLPRIKHLVSEVRGLLLPHELDIKNVRGEGYYLSPIGNAS